MSKTARRVVSIICTICMLFTTCGTLSFASETTADSVKGMIDELILAGVSLENWSDYKADVDAAVAAEAELGEDEKALFDAMATEDGTLYGDILDELALIMETGPVYDGIMGLPKNGYDLETGEWIVAIDKDNYQEWYEFIVDLGVKMDNITTEQQVLLGGSVLNFYTESAKNCKFYWDDYAYSVADALANVHESNVAWETKTDVEKLADYQTKRAQLEKAQLKVEGLYTTDNATYKPDQLDDVNTMLASEEFGIEKTAGEILEAAQALVDGIYDSSMNAIIAIEEEIEAMLPITIDNCADIFAKASEGLAKYDALRTAIGENYWDALKDDELEASLTAHKEDSAEWMDAKAFKDVVDALVADIDEGITNDNYSALVDKYEDALAVYEALSDDEKALAPAVDAKTALDGAGEALEAYATAWAGTVVAAIDAIPEFDHATYKNADDWKAVVDAIDAARKAFTEIKTKAAALVDDVDNYADLEAAEAERDEIIADYAAAGKVDILIAALGTVGDLPTDDIKLTSGTDIEKAREEYEKLTDTQKTLVEKIADLVAAEEEYAILAEQKEIIEGYIAAFNTEKAKIDYTTSGEDIETAFGAAKTAYDAAVAIADNTEEYGTKLSGLVTALKADMTALEAKVNAITDLRAKGDALVAAVEAICECVDIRDTENLESRLIAWAVTEDAIDLMNELFANAGDAYAAYNAAVTACEASYGEIPVADVLYAGYEADKTNYEVASAIWFEINPIDAVAAVVDWVAAVEDLFDSIDEACETDLDGTVIAYEALVEEYEGFEIVAKNYLYVNYIDALSKYDYINVRIRQYLNAKEIIEVANSVEVPELPAKYDGVEVTLDAYKEEIDAYEVELEAASEAITHAYSTYNNSDRATKEIPGVVEAYEALQDKDAECEIRWEALKFDKKVIAAADTFSTATPATYEEVIALKEENAALDLAVKDSTTSGNLLLDIEVYAVEDLIDAIGEFDINSIIDDRTAVTDKIDKAGAAYDILIDDTQKVKVSNYDVLEAAETLLAQIDAAIAFINAVNALEVVDANNWEEVKAAAEALRAEYDEFDDVTKGMVADAYITLQKKQAEVVTFMLSLLPELETVRGYVIPDDMDAINEVIELLYAIDHTEDGVKGGAYRELTAYSRLRVVGYARYDVTIEELKSLLVEYNEYMAANVIETINAIGYYDEAGNITMAWDNYKDYLDEIEAAEAAYAAYTAEIDELTSVFGALVDSFVLPYGVTNKTTMEEARTDYDKYAAAEADAAGVRELLDTFFATYPTVDAVTRDNYKTVYEDVIAIQEAYDALGALSKKFVEEGVDALAGYLDKYYAVERYMAVVEAIEELIGSEENPTSMYYDIVENKAFDASYGLIIAEIEADYDELTAEEKLEVDNYAKLETARDQYNVNVANAIATTIEKIDAIYSEAALEDFALTNENLAIAIDEANDWFDSLSAENQAKVTNADKLVAANEKIASLTDPGAVIDAIDALGNPEDSEITDETYDAIKAEVEAARALYETLAGDDKTYVNELMFDEAEEITYLAVLMAWEENVEAFEPDRSGDINDDGEVTVTDIAAMVDYVLKRVEFDETQFERANLVADEIIDIFDILAAIELILF